MVVVVVVLVMLLRRTVAVAAVTSSLQHQPVAHSFYPLANDWTWCQMMARSLDFFFLKSGIWLGAVNLRFMMTILVVLVSYAAAAHLTIQSKLSDQLPNLQERGAPSLSMRPPACPLVPTLLLHLAAS